MLCLVVLVEIVFIMHMHRSEYLQLKSCTGFLFFSSFYCIKNLGERVSTWDFFLGNEWLAIRPHLSLKITRSNNMSENYICGG